MKKLKQIILVFSIFLFHSCEKEKINVQEIEGYVFSYNPKNSSRENTVNAILSAINREQESTAAENNEKTYKGYGIKDENGNITAPKIENTEYMLVFNEQEFDKVIENANNYGQKPTNPVDFSKEFVFVLIHPSKLMSGLQFYDGLDALIENENTIIIKPSLTELPYVKNENSIYNYGENNIQVHLFKIPKSTFKTIIIEWKTGNRETLKMGQ
jgi:hypothetical protein